MSIRTRGGLGALVLAALAWIPAGTWIGDASGEPSQLEAFAWLEGHWVAEHGDVFLEEIWTAPSGDALMCIFRWQEKGKTQLYEIVAIEQQGEDVKMLLCHFQSGLKIWASEKESPMTFALESQGEKEAVFVQKSEEGVKRIRYWLEGDVLKARVWDEAGKENLEFEYQRRVAKAKR